MTPAFDALVERIKRLRLLPREVARESAPLVEEALKKQVQAGLDPSGKPWPLKKDGGKPLEHAADAISVEAKGETIRMTLTGKEVFHHHGVKGGAPQRRILPEPGELPSHIAEAIQEGTRRAWARMWGGR